MPLIVSLHRCHGSCNTLDINLSSKIGAPNKTEDVNLNVFNMITGINESKTLKEHMSYICRCKFGGKNVVQTKSGITISVNVTGKS